MTQDRPQAAHIGNRLLSLLFLAIGLVDLIAGRTLDGGVWVALGLGMVVLGSEATPWGAIPRWRRIVGGLLVIASVGLLIARVAADILA